MLAFTLTSQCSMDPKSSNENHLELFRRNFNRVYLYINTHMALGPVDGATLLSFELAPYLDEDEDF